MRKRALKKDFFMEIKKSLNRFLSIFFIVAMGVAFYSGIQASAPDMRITGDSYFDDSNLMDVRVIGTLGLTDDDMEALRQLDGVETVEPSYMTDVLCGEGEDQKVLHIEALLQTINQLNIQEGRLPEKGGECFLDQDFLLQTEYQVGDTIEVILPDDEEDDTDTEDRQEAGAAIETRSVGGEDDTDTAEGEATDPDDGGAEEDADPDDGEEEGKLLRTTTFQIVGSGYSSEYLSFNRGSSSLGNGEVAGFMYILPEDFDSEVYTVAYLSVDGAKTAASYSDEYKDLVERVMDAAEEIEGVRCEARYQEVREEAQDALADARTQVSDGEKELADAKKELEDGRKEAESELTQARADLENGESELEDGKRKLADAKKELDDARAQIADGEAEIAGNEAKLSDAWDQIASGESQFSSAESQLKEKQAQYDSVAATTKKQLDDGQKQLDQARKELETNRTALETEKQKLQEALQKSSEAAQTLESSRQQYESGAAALADGETAWKQGESEYEAGAAVIGQRESEYTAGMAAYEQGESEYAAGEAAYEQGESEYAAGEAAYEQAESEYAAGEAAYEQGESEYATQYAAYEQGEAEYAARIDGLRERYTMLQASSAKLKEQYEATASDLAAQQEAKAAAENTAAANTATAQDLRSQNEGLAAKQGAAQSELDSATAAVAAAEGEVSEANAQISSLKTTRAELQKKLEATEDEEERKKLNAQLQEADASLEAQQSVLANAQAKLAGCQEQQASCQAAYNDLAGQISANEADISAAEAAAEQAKAQAEELEGRIEELSASLSEQAPKVAEAETAAAGAKTELDTTLAAMEGVRAELDAAKEQLEQGRAELDATKAKLETSREQLDATKAQLSTSREQLDATKTKLETSRAQLDATKTQLDTGRAELDAAKVQLDSSRKQLDSSRAELDARTEELRTAKEQLDAGQKQYDEGQAQLAAGQEQLAAGETQLEQGQSEIDKNQKEIDAGRKELSDADAQLKSGWKQLESSRAELNAARDQASSGQAQLDAGKQTLADSKVQLRDGENEIAEAESEIAENEQKIRDGWKDYQEGRQEATEKISEGEAEIADAEKELADARAKIADAEKEIDEIEEPSWYVHDRNVLPEYSGYGENADRMKNIGQVFPVLFFLVAALISLTTMTRMVEEERTQIGTLKALGYSKWDIASKYMKYALYATLGGSVFGFLIGQKILPYIILFAYGMMYHHMPRLLIPYNWQYGLAATGASLVCTLGATLAACYRELGATPAVLMRPPTPKEGKRVWLEYLPFLWRRLNFSWKSTVRNLFRYKKRFFMTVIGIGGCMGLLLVGFGLHDSIMGIAVLQYEELQYYDAMVVLNEKASDGDLAQLDEYLAGEPLVTADKKIFAQRITVTNGEREYTPYLYVPEDVQELDSFMVFRDRVTKEQYHLSDEGAIVTEKLANMLGLGVGDLITIRDDDRGELQVPIASIAENYLYHYVYMTPALYEKVYGQPYESNSILVNVDSEDQAQIQQLGGEMLAMDAVLNVTYTGTIADQMDDMLGSLDIVIAVLIISAGMLAFVVLYNLNNININERKRELATIKVLGFYDPEVAAYVYRENILLTAIGAAAGVVIGIFLHRFIITTVEVDACMFGRNLNFISFVYGTLFTFGFSAFVNGVMYFKLKKIDMVESLKSVE